MSNKLHICLNMSNSAEKIKTSTKKVFVWSAVWILATAGVVFGPKNLWNFDTWITIIAVVIHIGIGLVLIRALRQNLLAMDELHRKIHLDAMAWSLGIGLVLGCTYEMLEDIKLITFQPEIPHLILTMSLAYVAGVVQGIRKYQ